MKSNPRPSLKQLRKVKARLTAKLRKASRAIDTRDKLNSQIDRLAQRLVIMSDDRFIVNAVAITEEFLQKLNDK